MAIIRQQQKSAAVTAPKKPVVEKPVLANQKAVPPKNPVATILSVYYKAGKNANILLPTKERNSIRAYRRAVKELRQKKMYHGKN